MPLTGSNAGVGRSIANATTMALLDTKTERLRITTYDTGKGAAAAAQRAVAEGNKLILGPLTAEEVRATAPVARAAGVPIISYSNDLSVAGNGVYLLGYMPEQSIERVVGYARGRGLSNFAALVPKGVYGERAGSAFLAKVKAAGGTLVAMETFDRSPASVSAAVKKLAASSSYDALLIADVGRIALQAGPLVRANGGASARSSARSCGMPRRTYRKHGAARCLVCQCLGRTLSHALNQISRLLWRCALPTGLVKL